VIDWVYGLPLGWLIVVVVTGTLVVAGLIWAVVGGLARGQRADTFAAVSPGMLPPLGIVFALVVGFLAAGVWNDASNARVAVNAEASALRTADLLVGSFPEPEAARMRALLRAQIKEDVDDDWPAMARRRQTLTVIPVALADALRLALQLRPQTAGQGVAQRELAVSLEKALDARRQRIIISQSRVNWAKWSGVLALAVIALVAIACVHAGRRATAAIAMGLFASAVAVSLILIVSQDRPFSGPFGIKPSPLEQVIPAAR
jgi:Protein of unknown function (DUF4239)